MSEKGRSRSRWKLLKFLKIRTSSSSAKISDLEPTFKGAYLGNVVNGWAKGVDCANKSLATLWKNHTASEKPAMTMQVTIAHCGMKAKTEEHGLTEYWANRITTCGTEASYPGLFYWIYRHEGKKMKQELRCHALLCENAAKAEAMATLLTQRLHQALEDFKKEKVDRQNARLSLANSVYDNPTMPNRKILLHTGTSNYRMGKSKTAPKLKDIEEALIEAYSSSESSRTDLHKEDSVTSYKPMNNVKDQEDEISCEGDLTVQSDFVRSQFCIDI